MDAINTINTQALIQLNRERKHLTTQQYKTLRGQILAGNIDGALKGLAKLTRTRGGQGQNDPETRQGSGRRPR